jgi:uncharacterized membrane protein
LVIVEVTAWQRLYRTREVVGMMMFGHGGHSAVWQVGFMAIVMIVVLGLLVWAAYALIGSANRASNHERHEDHPRRTLYQRLAAGEIDGDEYRRRCDVMADENRTTVESRRRSSASSLQSSEGD